MKKLLLILLLITLSISTGGTMNIVSPETLFKPYLSCADEPDENGSYWRWRSDTPKEVKEKFKEWQKSQDRIDKMREEGIIP